MNRRAIFVAAALLAACSSGVDHQGATGGQASGAGGAGGATTGAGGAGGEAPQCPGVMPVPYEPCPALDLSCTWEANGCSHTGACTETGWAIESEPGCACPAALPYDGSACTAPSGHTCEYPAAGACSSTTFTATCGADGDWHVASNATGCGFTCPDWPTDEQLAAPCDPCCDHPCFGGANCSYFWMYCDGGTWQAIYTPC